MNLQTIDGMIMSRLEPGQWVKIDAGRRLPPVWWAEVPGQESHRWQPRPHHEVAVCRDEAELSMSWGVDLAPHGETGQPEWVAQMTLRKHAGEHASTLPGAVP